MFDVSPILWLQSLSFPAMTAAMNVVSLFGYVPSVVAMGAVAAFGWQMRRGVVLLLIVAIAAVLTDASKSLFASPRPSEADQRVRVLGSFPAPAFDNDVPDAGTPYGRFGFPSGHTAAATAFGVSLWWLVRRRGLGPIVVVWIALTALSRVYLGRHYPIDVIGGLVVGASALLAGWRPLSLDAVVDHARDQRAIPALAAAALAAALVTLASDRIEPANTGRLCGLAFAALLLIRQTRADFSGTPLRRAAAGLVALVLVGCTVALPPIGIEPDVASRATHLAIAAALNAAVLLVPALMFSVRAPWRSRA